MVKAATEKTTAAKPTIVLKLTEMKERLVDKALKEADYDPPASVAFDRKVEMLDTHYRKIVERDELIACTRCGGHSSDQLESCPFCGLSDTPKHPREAPSNGVASGAALTVVEGAKGKISSRPPGFTQAALDTVNAEISDLKHDMAQNWWQMGQTIKTKIFDTELWKVREGEEGKPRYRSFEQWAKAEQGFTSVTVYSMMDVAAKFSAEQVRKMGYSKLDLVLRAPDAEQDDLVREVEKGATQREVRQLVKKAREKHALTRRNTGRRATGAAAKGKKMGRPVGGSKNAKRFTVALVFGKTLVPLYAKPKEKLEPGQLPDRRAKRLSDLPVGFHELENGVQQFFRLVNKASGWAIEIETRRPQPAAS